MAEGLSLSHGLDGLGQKGRARRLLFAWRFPLALGALAGAISAALLWLGPPGTTRRRTTADSDRTRATRLDPDYRGERVVQERVRDEDPAPRVPVVVPGRQPVVLEQPELVDVRRRVVPGRAEPEECRRDRSGERAERKREAPREQQPPRASFLAQPVQAMTQGQSLGHVWENLARPAELLFGEGARRSSGSERRKSTYERSASSRPTSRPLRCDCTSGARAARGTAPPASRLPHSSDGIDAIAGSNTSFSQRPASAASEIGGSPLPRAPPGTRPRRRGAGAPGSPARAARSAAAAVAGDGPARRLCERSRSR